MSVPPHVVDGAELPALAIPLSRAFVVATAIASRDYQDVHHDPEAAQASGASDVFLNILTSNALVERFLRAWAGPAARLTALRIRLGVPSPAGETVVLTGRVSRVEGDRADVEILGTNSAGVHITGEAGLAWPEGSAA